MAVLHEDRRGGNPAESIGGHPGEHHPQAQGIENLAQVDQVDLGLTLEHRIHLVREGIAVDRNGEVVRQGRANRDGDVPRTARPRQAHIVAPARATQGGGFRRQAVLPVWEQFSHHVHGFREGAGPLGWAGAQMQRAFSLGRLVGQGIG